MSRARWIAAHVALLLLAGCSSDNPLPPDGGGGPLVPFVDQGAPPDLPRPPAVDGPPPVLDHGSPPQGGDGPVGSGANTGALCGYDEPCAGTDECIYLAPGKGMCLAPCESQGDACAVADSATQGSFCAIKDPQNPQWRCAWFCRLGSKTFDCPNDHAYDCVPTANGDAELCQPK